MFFFTGPKFSHFSLSRRPKILLAAAVFFISILMHSSPLTYTWQIIMADRHGKIKGIKKLSLCKKFSTKFSFFFFLHLYFISVTIQVERIERNFLTWQQLLACYFMDQDCAIVNNFMEGKYPFLWVGMLLITGFVLVYQKNISLNSQIWIFHSVSLLHFIVGVYLVCICMREIPSHYIIPLSACIFYPHKKSLNWFHHKQVNVTRGINSVTLLNV